MDAGREAIVPGGSVMRRDYRILVRAIDRMRRRAKAAEAVYRIVGMMIGVELACAGKTTRGPLA
jgi:hypothetical protein